MLQGQCPALIDPELAPDRGSSKASFVRYQALLRFVVQSGQLRGEKLEARKPLAY